MNIEAVLAQVEQGSISAAQALELLRNGTETNLGFARVDTDRLRRRGMPEVIFCPFSTFRMALTGR